MSTARVLCACVWRGKRCDRQATQEDLLCNWCGNGRTEDQLRLDPKAAILPDGTFMGIGGGGPHDGTYENPGACWYPDSGRTVEHLTDRASAAPAPTASEVPDA